MIFENENVCPACGGTLKYYDKTNRFIRGKFGAKRSVTIERYRCQCCSRTHRRFPSYIFPFKQYESDIIIGVVEDLITNETLGFEDYPCELTMKRWHASFTSAIMKNYFYGG